MKPLLLISVILLTTMIVYSQEVIVNVKINVKEVHSKIEFKIESDSKGEQSTKWITATGEKNYVFKMGPKSTQSSVNNVWFWWDTLDGIADITISVNGIVVFEGTGEHRGDGEQHVAKTSTDLRLMKKQGSPRLIDDPNYPNTNLQIWWDF